MKVSLVVLVLGIVFCLSPRTAEALRSFSPYLGVSLYEFGSFPLLEDDQNLFDSLSHEFSLGAVYSVFKEPKKRTNRKGKRKRRLRIPGGVHYGGELNYAFGQVGNNSYGALQKMGGRIFTGRFALMALWYVGAHAAVGWPNDPRSNDRRRFAEFGLSAGAGTTMLLGLNASLSYVYGLGDVEGELKSPLALKLNFVKFLFPIAKPLVSVEPETPPR